MKDWDFYEKECLGRVKLFATMLDDLHHNPFDRGDAEAFVEGCEDAWQSELEELFYKVNGDDAEPVVDYYKLEGQALVDALKASGIEYDEDEAEEYLDNKDKLENWECGSLREYFEDVLDIEYVVGGDKKYRSVNVTIATGGT